MGAMARDLPAQKPVGGCRQQDVPGLCSGAPRHPGQEPPATCPGPLICRGPFPATRALLWEGCTLLGGAPGRGSARVSSAGRQSTGQRQGESSGSLGEGARWPCTGSQRTPPLTLLRVPLLGGLSLLGLRARHWWAEKQSAGGSGVLAPQSRGGRSDTPNITQHQTSAQDFHSARAARLLPLPPATSPDALSPARSKPDPTTGAVPPTALRREQNNLAAPGRERCFEARLAAELVVTGLRALPSLCWATEERLCLDPTQRTRCLVVLKPILL